MLSNIHGSPAPIGCEGISPGSVPLFHVRFMKYFPVSIVEDREDGTELTGGEARHE